ncbi:MAG: mucoidy inhibitor MuiA family protein [bacterium]
MKRSIVLLGAVAWFFNSALPVLGDKIITDSTISEVIVYRDRAMVFRKAQLHLVPGTHQILFQYLPTALLTDSLRVRTRSVPVRILGVNSRLVTLREQKETLDRQLRNQLRRMQDDLQVLLDKQQTYTELIEFYRRMGDNAGALVAEELIHGSSGSIDWQNLYGVLAEKLSEIRGSVRDLEPKKRELEERIASIEEDISNIDETVSEAYEVTVDVETTEAADSDVVISYVVQGADWSPAYDVRYLEEEELLDITYGAIIRQRTGESWSDVLLTLSTARPLLYGRPKDLTPWTIGFQPTLEAKPAGPEQTVPKEINSAEVSSAAEMNKNTAATAGSLFGPENLGRLDLGEELESVSVSFRIPTPETVLSGPLDKKVTVATFRSPARLQYTAIPRQGPYTFLRAIMTNDSTYPILQGKANIFFGNDFLSTSSIQNTMPGSTLDFYLGTDSEIEVRRTELERNLDSSGLILTTGQEISWRWELAVMNRRDTQIVLEVVDQIPVSQNEDIKVEDFRCRGYTFNRGQDGTVRWVLNLGPKENRTIVYSYKIKFPKGAKLNGLDG